VFSGVRDFRAAAFRTREELDVNVRTRVAKLLHHDLVGERPSLGTEDLASFARQHLEADRENVEALWATLTGLGLELPDSISRARQILTRMRTENDEELVQSLDGGRADLKDGILAARALKQYVDDERLEVLRRAGHLLSYEGQELSEAGQAALMTGREILRTCAYTDRFPELRGTIEIVETERQAAWEDARERLRHAIDEIRDQAAGLLDQIGEGARAEFEARLRNVAVPDGATSADGPSRETMLVRAAQLPRLVDDLRVEIGRRQGKEVRRIAVRELFSEPVRNEEELEALLDRIRAAAEEALRDDDYFLLI
jgi:hypothetical protein